MGRFTNTVEKYRPYLEQLMGNVADISIKNRYSDAIGELRKVEQTKADYDKFMRLNRSLSGVNLQDKDIQKETGDYKLNVNDPSVLNSTKAYQNYHTTLKPPTDEQGQPITGLNGETASTIPPDETGFLSYLKANPDAMAEVQQAGYIKPVYGQLGDEEIKQKLYEKAGLVPEDVAFYNEFKKKNFNQTAYNQKINNLILDNYPNLVSQGKAGDTFANLYSKKAGQLGIAEEKPKEYKYLNLSNGQVLRYDDYGNHELIDVNPKGSKKDLENDRANWQGEQVDGEWYWGYRGPNGFVLKGKMTQTEQEDYLRERQMKENKLEKSAPGYTISKSGTRRRYTSRSKTGGDKKEKLEPLDSELDAIRELSNGKTWEQIPELDRTKIEMHMEKVKNLTKSEGGKPKSNDEIWKLVSDYSAGNQNTEEAAPKTQTDYDFNEAYNQTYDELGMKYMWEDMENRSRDEQDFKFKYKLYAKEIKDMIDGGMNKEVGAAIWSEFERAAGRIWNTLNDGGRFK